jgi:hypothetical protein
VGQRPQIPWNPAVVMPAVRPSGEEETAGSGPLYLDRMRGSGALGVVHWRLMKQKQYSSTPPEPSPGARKCSLSTMWLWPPAKGL